MAFHAPRDKRVVRSTVRLTRDNSELALIRNVFVILTQWYCAHIDETALNPQGGYGSTPYRRTDQQPSSGAPPASDDAISRLPEVTFQGADLVADGDKSCPICLEQHRVGGKGVRLPCGHCFHAFCVRPWLEKHCMCPVCRFEIPTSDSEYEWSRRQRMKSRKRRVRLSELEGYSIKQLRGLATELSINLSTAIEKRDVVEAISSSHQVEIVAEAAEPCFGMRNESSFPTAYGGNSQGVQSTSRPMEDLPIGELLGIAKVHGLNIKGCTEKHDLICIIRDAGIR